MLDGYRDFPFIEKGKLRNTVILCHRRADADAYCSAYAVSRLLKQINSRVNVVAAAPGGFGVLARRLQERFKMQVVDEPTFEDLDLIVIVDTGHVSLLAKWADTLQSVKTTKISIDHHPLNESVRRLSDFLIRDESASATSEVTYDIFEAKGVKMTRSVAQAILTGILFDSQHLKLADCRTIRTVARLCEKGASLEDSKKLLDVPRNFSETVARLKAAQRVKIYRSGRWIIATTFIGSYQASAARAFVDLGADVALAIGSNHKECKGSIRASQTFLRGTALNLGVEVVEEGASIMGGVGGGHSTAASFVAEVSRHKATDVILSLLSKRLNSVMEKIH